MASTSPLPIADAELVGDIEDALCPSTDLNRLSAVAHRLRSEQGRLLATIRDVLADDGLLAALAARSYRHTNGFTKVRLGVHEGFDVRLHLWPSSTTLRGEANPHGHQWRFASWVVCGSGMRERFYERSRDATGPLLHRYVFGSTTDGAWAVDHIEVVHLNETHTLDRPTGTVYSCPVGTVHTVAPLTDEFVATLVVQGQDIRTYADVYTPPGRCPRANECPISPADLAADMVTLERALDAAGRSDTSSPVSDHVPWSFLDATIEDNSGAFR